MKIRRDVIVQSILKYQRSFLQILDYINKNSGVLETPVTLYLNLYAKEIIVEAENKNDINAHNQLSIESLVESGIFVYHNKNTGMLVLDNAIFELLRFIDVSRARELNREDFEVLRGHIELTIKNVVKHSVDSEQYQDAMQAFYSVMNETLSKLRSNVEKLVTKVDEIAVEYKIFESNGRLSFIELYEKVQFLYRRYVLPCYEFISPSLQLVSKQGFSQSIDELIEYHQEQGFDSVANMIGFNKTAITSYFKDISELEGKLKQYSNRLESDRNFFISVENAYTALMESVQELRHGKQRRFLLSHDSKFFSHYKYLDGLSTHKAKFDSGLRWQKDKSIKRFKEYLRFIDEIQVESSRSPILISLPAEIDLEEERKIQVAEMVYTLELAGITKDVHKYLYEILSSSLSEFSMVDILFALECVHDIYDQEIVTSSFEQSGLSDDKYYLSYLPITILESTNV